mmetsp:Transcript_13142/g.22225  ORF Transcript_13142/g.22225 Transcript_13142/m.22225 type:complete len:117 (-) Transcript_13142:1201-1551(-)
MKEKARLRDFAKVTNARSVFLNEMPAQFDPYLNKIAKLDQMKLDPTLKDKKPNAKPPRKIDEDSVSDDSSDSNCIIIPSKEPKQEPAPAKVPEPKVPSRMNSSSFVNAPSVKPDYQ